MTLESTTKGRRQPKKTGAHRKRRKHHSALTRTVAAGGAAICIGAAYDLSTPTADALSILIPGRTVDGVGNTTRINIFEGNIFMPQLGLGGNVSNNSTVGNVAIGNGNDIISQLLNFEIRLGGAVGNGNTTQINLFSYNIFNPQWSLLGGNLSNNTSIGNVAMNNGNNSSAATSVGSLFPWLGGPAGNGNTFQFAFFSGNIFNPQYSLLGNVSNNTTVTNAAINNGNYSRTAATSVAVMTSLLGGTTGNGNTFQLAFFVSNIFNPQYSFGGGNTSNNTATTNTASGNGNNSTTGTTGGGTSVGGTTGNGNTTQVEGGSGNIYNDQVNVGVNLAGSNSTTSSHQQQSLALNTDSSNSLNSTGSRTSSASTVSSTSTASDTQQQSLDPGTVSSSSSNSTTSGSQSLSFAPKVSDTSAPSTSSTNDTGSASTAGGDAGSSGGTSGGSSDGGGGGGGV
jgi:hypothetical protein